jgi:hypothetical protein
MTLPEPPCCQKRCGHQKRRGLVKITRNNWKPKNDKSRCPVVSRDFDKPAAFLVPAAFLAALGTLSAEDLMRNIFMCIHVYNLIYDSRLIIHVLL